MAKREWTEKQLQSITATGGTVLVSAAAGSGKTAVLVERVIRRITDPVNPVDVDKLLIVTFTRAAAAEMRQRLGAALAEKMVAEPENPLYQRQQLLLPQAHISTIHGFCAKLLQQYAGQAELPVGFKVAEDAQAALLAAEALDTVLEEAYRLGDANFLVLANQLNSHKNDSGLREAVMEAYQFMQAQPFPERWLAAQLEAYTQVIPLEKTAWMQPILREISLILETACLLAERIVNMATMDGLEPYLDVLKPECKRLQELKDLVFAVDYDTLYRTITGFAFSPLPGARSKDAAVVECRGQVQALRKRLKEKVGHAAGMLCGDEAACRDDLAQMAPLAEALGTLVDNYTRRYTLLKRQQKLLDYNDLEHEALRLLLEGETGCPTPLAVELSGHFAEIMVDEYQDTNAAQDALFRALSRKEQNLFMVGDVKQSIYSFRQAMPEIFTGKRDTFAPYDPETPIYPATITLENNFRSRLQVTDTVNFLFRQLMQKSLGGVIYEGTEELVCSAPYPPEEREDYRTRWLLVDTAAGDEPVAADMAEIHCVAGKIRELMATGTVQAGDSTRPMQWRDICILLSTHRTIARFATELGRLGIPTAGEAGGSLLTAPEVRSVLSLLRVVDNPLREVELAAVLLSPLYGFTPDELATLRLSGGRKTPLYTLLERYSRPGDDRDEALEARCGAVLADLRRYRMLAVSLPADRLLEQIYRETGLEAIYAARAGGHQRVANLRQLDQVARGFEQGGFRGLSAFIAYVDKLEEKEKKLPAGSVQRQDGVRLMTVHGSKGLEFPVVFLARLSGKGNNEDARQKLLFHATAGIGLRLVDEEENEKHLTLPYAGVQSARRLDEGAEALRVWYVALTRARERLYLVYSAKDMPKKLAKLAAEIPATPTLLPETVLRATAPGDFLLTAALRHRDFIPYRPDGLSSLPSATAWAVELYAPSIQETATAGESAFPAPDESLTATLRRRLTYTYPYEALLGVPAKLAASQLSHQAMHREHIASARPAFLQQEGMTAAQKGTALHTFMQYADLGRAEDDLSAEAARLVAEGFLTAEQEEALPLDKLQNFLTGYLYARMKEAKQVWREYPFTLAVEAGTLTALPAEMAGETVVVQGIADCVFREGDGLVLVDYKTDRVKTGEELVDRYRSQLAFYRRALEPILGLPVKEMLLYSFALDTDIEIK